MVACTDAERTPQRAPQKTYVIVGLAYAAKDVTTTPAVQLEIHTRSQYFIVLIGYSWTNSESFAAFESVELSPVPHAFLSEIHFMPRRYSA